MCHALVTVSHDVVTAVIDTAKEESANMIIIGWKGYTHTQKRILGRKMDLILRLTPCDVLFIKSDEKLKPLRILILSGGLWHVSAATEVAAMVAKKQGARVTILNVIVDEKYLERATSLFKATDKHPRSAERARAHQGDTPGNDRRRCYRRIDGR